MKSVNELYSEGIKELNEEHQLKKVALIRKLISPLVEFHNGDILEAKGGDRFVADRISYGLSFSGKPTAFLSGRILTRKGDFRVDCSRLTREYDELIKVGEFNR